MHYRGRQWKYILDEQRQRYYALTITPSTAQGGGWEVLPKRRGREELRHRRVERELIRDRSSRRRARAKVNGMHFGRKGACSGVPVAPVSSVPAAPPASAANIMSVIGRREQERRYLVARENELCFANRHLSNERDGPYTFCWR
jgi:hypothetical protein